MHSLKSAITSGNSIQDSFCSPSRATEAIICKILVRQETFHQKTTTLTTTLTRRTKRDVVDSDVSKIGNAVVKRVISVECGLHFEIFTGLLTVRGIVDSTGIYETPGTLWTCGMGSLDWRRRDSVSSHLFFSLGFQDPQCESRTHSGLSNWIAQSIPKQP